MAKMKQMVYEVADSDWRIEFLNFLGKMLYKRKGTYVIVLHDSNEETELG